jgi:hypothetical protein
VVASHQLRNAHLYQGPGHKKRLTHNHQVCVMSLPASLELISRGFFKKIIQNATPSLKTAGDVNIYGGGAWQIYSNQARTPHPNLLESLRIINGLFELTHFTSWSMLPSGVIHWLSEVLPCLCRYSQPHNTLT